jgi:hypothetical protein
MRTGSLTFWFTPVVQDQAAKIMHFPRFKKKKKSKNPAISQSLKTMKCSAMCHSWHVTIPVLSSDLHLGERKKPEKW